MFGLIEIREERPDDVAAVRDLNKRAFGQDQESNIVDALRANGAALLSLVAARDDQVVGHIMYSPLTVGDNVSGAALGPMAVLPEFQRQGIGSKLIEAGNRKLKDAGFPFIIVVGHADYFPDSDSDLPANMESSANGMFPMMSSCCWFWTKRKWRALPGWQSTGMNSRAFLRLVNALVAVENGDKSDHIDLRITLKETKQGN
jgi:putative acetyltransferase